MDAFKQLEPKVRNTKFISLTGDDSTDITSIENSLWYVQTAVHGRIIADFLGLQEFCKKLVSTTTDGASVMLGRASGVCVLLQQRTPGRSMIMLHCMAHRLELAIKDACMKLPLYADGVKWLADKLYYFYQRSYLNRANLRNAANCIICEVQAINL